MATDKSTPSESLPTIDNAPGHRYVLAEEEDSGLVPTIWPFKAEWMEFVGQDGLPEWEEAMRTKVGLPSDARMAAKPGALPHLVRETVGTTATTGAMVAELRHLGILTQVGDLHAELVAHWIRRAGGQASLVYADCVPGQGGLSYNPPRPPRHSCAPAMASSR